MVKVKRRDVVSLQQGFTLVLFFLITSFLNAQRLQTYDSLYHSALGYSGHATFKYYKNGDDQHIKEGFMTFESKSVDTVCGTNVAHVHWDGNYKANRKINEWNYWNVSNELNLVDIDDKFTVNYTLNSESEHIVANYRDGLPHGSWKLLSQKLINGKSEDIIHSFEGKIDKNKFEGVIALSGLDESGSRFSITGTVKSGLMEGKWVFVYVADNIETREERIYQQGFLKSLVKISAKNGDVLENIDYPLSIQIQDYLQGKGTAVQPANQPLGITFSDGYPRHSSFILAQKKGNQFLMTSLEKVFKFDPDFFKDYGLPIGTNRMTYPLSSEEKKLVKEWPDVSHTYSEKVNSLKDTRTLSLKHTGNDTLNLIDAWVERQMYLIDYIKPWNSIFALNEIEFYNREGRLYNYAVDLLVEDSLEFGDGAYAMVYPSNAKLDSNFLAYALDNFKERIKMADSLTSLYENVIRVLNLEDNIVQLETQIVQKKKQLDSVYAVDEDIHPKMSELKKAVTRNFLENSFEQEYDAFINFKGKVDIQKKKGDSIVHFLTVLSVIEERMQTIFLNVVKLDSTYTEYVFDPYTFNDQVPVRKKKRLYQHIAEDLFHDLLKEAMQATSKMELVRTISRIENVQEQLFFLVDKDTRKLERKLKKNMSVEKKLELLKPINRRS